MCKKCDFYKDDGEGITTLKTVEIPILKVYNNIQETIMIDLDMSIDSRKDKFEKPDLELYIDLGDKGDRTDRKFIKCVHIPIKYCPFCGRKIEVGGGKS